LLIVIVVAIVIVIEISARMGKGIDDDHDHDDEETSVRLNPLNPLRIFCQSHMANSVSQKRMNAPGRGEKISRKERKDHKEAVS
jgi:hypothetical protein